MSADNWTNCPNCVRLAEADRQKAVAKAEKSYGKVPAAEYAELLKAAEETPKPKEQTLREDYSIGVGVDGTFSVSYTCYCKACAWKFGHKYDQPAI